MGLVEGTVTLDGKPYPNAMVVFMPEGGGRSSQAITDEAGHYELIYIRTTRGATVGNHQVMITTVPMMPEGENVELSDRPKEVIPLRYNRRSELERTVQKGENTFDFALTTKS